MRLIQCHIENFGKLQNQDITFCDGYNEFHYENGWGKSTLAAFLKVMFYGFENERSRDDYINERKRFRPWQGGVYGGSLTFEVNEKVYTVTRNFGMKEKEDEFILREEETNLESHDFSSKLGEEIFRIDRGSFDRTICISQNDCETGMTDQIHAKIGNLTEATDDVKQYEKADARLNDLLNAMSPTRKTGSLYRLADQIAELEAELKRGEKLEQEIESLSSQKKKLQKEYEMIKDRQEELSQKQRKASISKDRQAKKERYDLLVEQLYQRKKKMEDLKCFFPVKLPIAEELNEMIRQCILLAAEENQMNKYDFTRQEGEPFKGGKADFLFVTARIFSIAFGIVFLRRNLAVSAILFAIGLLFAAVGMIQKKRILKKEEASKAYFSRKERLEHYILDLGFSPEMNLQTQLLDFKSRLEEYQFARTEFEKAQKGIDWFEEQFGLNGIWEEENTGGDSLEAMQSEMDEIQVRLETCHRNMVSLDRSIQDKMTERERIIEKEEALYSMREQYCHDLSKYERLKMTRFYLSQAKASFMAKYRNPLMNAFSKYYKMLGAAEDHPCLLDSNMNLTVQAYGCQREARYLSTGWKDFMGICLRLSLVDSMYQKEKPFLIWDDPFVSLDQNRTRASLAFLKEVSKEYQLLYFTCHESRKFVEK